MFDVVCCPVFYFSFQACHKAWMVENVSSNTHNNYCNIGYVREKVILIIHVVQDVVTCEKLLCFFTQKYCLC